MTTLHVILDQIVSEVPGGIGRYAEELTRALIETAPSGSDVAGVVSASPESDYERIATLLPGLTGLYKSPLARRELSAAWQHGVTRLPGHGLVHAMSLLAPLARHDRLNDLDQVAVTIHDAIPWTHPKTLTPRGVRWHRAMAARAQKYADAVVVPTHSVAAELADVFDFGDRVRVIGGAVSPRLALPIDADARAARLGLPERYLLSVGTLEPRKGLEPLIRSLAVPEAVDLPLIVVGQPGWGGVDVEQVASDAGLDPGRISVLGRLDDPDLAVVLARATVFVFPSLAEGFGLPVIEAFSLGTPVVHSDAPALLEVSDGAGLAVERTPAESYPNRLAQSIRSVADDPQLAKRLGYAGLDRAQAYDWKRSAEAVWQLHADL